MSDSTCTVDVCASPGPRGGPCKDCFNKRQLAKYYANREEHLAANKRWRDAHAEQVRANRNRWFAENADRRAEYLDLMRDERNELARQRRAANPGSGTEYSREWRRKNHDRFALRNREAARRRQTGSAHSRVTYRAVLERDGMVKCRSDRSLMEPPQMWHSITSSHSRRAVRILLKTSVQLTRCAICGRATRSSRSP